MDYQIIVDVRDSDRGSVATVVEAIIQNHGDALGFPEDCDVSVKQREVGEWVAADLTED